jgi:hypothetical protein
MSAVLSAISLEYIKVPVNVKKNGVYVNPTSSQVKMAFLSSKTAAPDTGDWKNASWESGLGHKYYIRCLVGPSGDITLTPDTYWVWIKILDAPEAPVRQVGSVRIT